MSHILKSSNERCVRQKVSERKKLVKLMSAFLEIDLVAFFFNIRQTCDIKVHTNLKILFLTLPLSIFLALTSHQNQTLNKTT